MKADAIKYTLNFKQPAGTSRGVLHSKDTYFIRVEHQNKTGYGECNLFRNLSADDRPDYEKKLEWLVNNIHLPKTEIIEALQDYASLLFGYETAIWSLQSTKSTILFPSAFTQGEAGIPINGLVWMGEKSFMLQQIKEKIAQGFKVVKLKIGAIDFQDELDLLKFIRNEFSPKDIEIRVDANGAFAPETALEKLKRLSDFEIHSIEQPIRQGQFEQMTELCRLSPIPIALDEELIGYNHKFDKDNFLQAIQPQYIILKPALHGGFVGTETWIKAAEKNNIGWWITSALESNIGLNAIAQYTYQKNVKVPQGLGTGMLYTNNIDSPLYIQKGELWVRNPLQWDGFDKRISKVFLTNKQ